MMIKQLTRDEVLHIMPNAKARVDTYLEYFNKYSEAYGVTTTLRMAHLLAQVAVESGELRYVRELASGAAYDTGAKAIALGNTPEKDGDGQRYKGRGLIQITGRANYAALSKDLGVDFVSQPELLELPEYAVLCVYWYWKKRGLNYLADADNITAITKKINGGTNGLAERKKYLKRAKEVFKL